MNILLYLWNKLFGRKKTTVVVEADVKTPTQPTKTITNNTASTIVWGRVSETGLRHHWIEGIVDDVWFTSCGRVSGKSKNQIIGGLKGEKCSRCISALRN